MASKKRKNQVDVITFHNQIRSSFREIHVDGAIGGITSAGFLNMNFFAERFPIPKSTDFSVIENKKIGEKLGDSIDSKTGIIREYEVGIYMGYETATAISKFLIDKLREWDELSQRHTDENVRASKK